MISPRNIHTTRCRWIRYRIAASLFQPHCTKQRYLNVAADSMSSTSLSRRLVVSRRAWNALKDSLPPKPPPSAQPKVEEKPWPQSVKIAGYVAGGILVPYIAIWWITSNSTLREWFGPFLPMNKFRSHFGHLEWNVQSYVDEFPFHDLAINKNKDNNHYDDDDDFILRTVIDKPQPNIEYFQFPDERPFRERQQQAMIDAMNNSKIQVKITLLPKSEHGPDSQFHPLQEATIYSLPARTLATVPNLLEVVKGSISSDPLDSTPMVALDFEDDQDDAENDFVESTSGGILIDDTSSTAASQANFDSKLLSSASLLKGTQTFSKWFYISPPQQQQQQQQQQAHVSSSTDMDVNISRLEFNIAQLQKSLKDPTCTRDRDEMALELRHARRELSAIKWKRRLGWS
jgi:hypothetical protein